MWELRNWFVIDLGNHGLVSQLLNPMVPPEQVGRHRLRGEVWFRPLYTNGTILGTTKIVGVKDGEQLVTMNSVYKLGDPDPVYEKSFPKAKERVIKSLDRLS